MVLEPLSMKSARVRLASDGCCLSIDKADHDRVHSPGDVESPVATSPQQSSSFTTPIKGKENCDWQQCTPNPLVASCEAFETPTKTPTRPRKAVVLCGNNSSSYDGRKALFSRDVTVKNTFVHLSPEHVKRPAETPPRSAPSNVWASESLFAKDMLVGLDETTNDSTCCASDVASASANVVEQCSEDAELPWHAEKSTWRSAFTMKTPGSPFTVPPTPEVFNRLDADRFSHHFPPAGLAPPLPHSTDALSFAPPSTGALGCTNMDAAAIAASAAFGMAQAASAFAAAAACKSVVAADVSLPPPPSMLPPPPSMSAPTPPLSVLPPPPQLTPGAFSTSARQEDSKVIRLLEHLTNEDVAQDYNHLTLLSGQHVSEVARLPEMHLPSHAQFASLPLPHQQPVNLYQQHLSEAAHTLPTASIFSSQPLPPCQFQQQHQHHHFLQQQQQQNVLHIDHFLH